LKQRGNIGKWVWGLWLVLLALPAIQGLFAPIRINPLQGAIEEPDTPALGLKAWWDAAFQVQAEAWLSHHVGFRPLWIRTNNQINYSFFNKAGARGVVVGKQRYLFEENYIKAYYGSDFIGKDSIGRRMDRLEFISETLQRQGKLLLLMFAAGKGSYYSEYIPEDRVQERGTTNHQIYLQEAQQRGIPVLDFHTYFLEQKNKSAYPLYPQYGIHWSEYGMALAGDSLIRRIEQQCGWRLPRISWDRVEWKQPRGTDCDIAGGMNLLWNMKSFPMAYPELQFESDKGKQRPAVLVISDSFYWGLFNFGISRSFNPGHFWFYNHEVYPKQFGGPSTVKQLKLLEEIARHDVVVIMATEATLPKLGWGFIESASAELGYEGSAAGVK
jgi:hypothetical protein